MINRIVTAADLSASTCFLWGPRQSGKSTLQRSLFPEAPYYDLLRAAEFRRLDQEDEGVWSLDLDRDICPFLPICDPIVQGVPVRLDGSHLSASFAEQLAGPLEAFLVDNGVLGDDTAG